MEYNINFCIISAAYLFITAVFYSRQTRTLSRRNSLFAGMLLCGIISLALDIFVAVLDRRAYLWPTWAVSAANILFLLSVQTSGVLFFNYTLNLTGAYARQTRWARILTVLPYAATAALLLLTPFLPRGAGVFYLDGDNVYHHGGAHLALYITMALYLVSSLAIVYLNRRRLQRVKFYTTLAFLLATLIAMLIQMNDPWLLVNSTANAFALTIIYFVLESPGAHTDALTGTLNRAAFLPMLRDVYEEGESCSLLVFTMDSLHIVNHSFGMKGGDEVLAAFAAYLRRAYPKAGVFRLEGDVFCVFLRGSAYIDSERLSDIYAGTQLDFDITAGRVTLGVSLACVNSADCESPQEMTRLLDILIQRHRDSALSGTVLADGEFKARLQKSEAVEKATMSALREERVEVYYQPIHSAAGRLCALEALVRVRDPVMGPLPTQELVELAEKNGSILTLGEQVLRKTCAFLRDNDAASWGLDHVGINLSAVQCVQEGMPELVSGILAEYAIPEGLVALEVTETAAGALAAVRHNMECLAERGVHFLLDDFGTGYANFRNLTALPYRCIKLDKSLLWDAGRSESRMRLLSGVIGVVHALGFTSLCEGVETGEQAELLASLGVSMLQGYYFSKPLPPEALVVYVEKQGVR